MGVAIIEGAYYDYDSDGAGAATVKGTEGNGYFVLASYLLPGKIGSGSLQGQLQPLVRYQRFVNEGSTSTGDRNRWDINLNYIINGHNARITAQYSIDDPASGLDADMFKIGLQFQI